MDDEEYERLLDRTLSGESADDNIAIAFMPSSYEPGSTQADTRMTSITQSTAGDGANGMGGGAISDEIIDSQLEIRELARDTRTGLPRLRRRRHHRRDQPIDG